MSIPGRQPPPSVSLDQQIRDLEQRLEQRRQSSTLHAAALKRSLRQKVRSPVTLLLAGAVGFALGLVVPLGKLGRPAHKDSKSAGGATVLAVTMDALTLVGAVMALLQATKTKR